MAESIPIHVLSGPDLMARQHAALHPDLQPGDAFLHNSPYHGNSHAGGHVALVPVFDDDGRHRFTVLAKAHLADMRQRRADARTPPWRGDVYEEGALIFPASRCRATTATSRTSSACARCASGCPSKWWGDYLALLGAARDRRARGPGPRGRGRLGPHSTHSSTPGSTTASAAWRRARPACPSGERTRGLPSRPVPAASPDGIPIKATVTSIADEPRIEVDLRDNPDCLPCGLNLTEATARSAAMLGVFNAHQRPRARRTPARSGASTCTCARTASSASRATPRAARSRPCNLADRIGNAVQRALAELGGGIRPGRGRPEHAGVRRRCISGHDPRNGDEPFINQLVLAWTGGPGGPARTAG